MNTDYITVTGVVATTPRHIVTAEGLAITEFRLASSRSRYDKANNSWIDQGTNWYSISTYRQKAINVNASISKGDRVVVMGRLVVKEWESADRRGISLDIDALALGHDLSFGTSSFTRSVSSASWAERPELAADPEESQPEVNGRVESEVSGQSENSRSGDKGPIQPESIPAPF